jgi:hypothetical protein
MGKLDESSEREEWDEGNISSNPLTSGCHSALEHSTSLIITQSDTTILLLLNVFVVLLPSG